MGLDKLKKLLKPGLKIGSLFAPGVVGSVLDIVGKTIDDENDPKNEQALRNLAQVNDAQTEVLTDHDARLAAIERKLNIK